MTSTDSDREVANVFATEVLKGRWAFVPGVGWHAWGHPLDHGTTPKKWELAHPVGQSPFDGTHMQSRLYGELREWLVTLLNTRVRQVLGTGFTGRRYLDNVANVRDAVDLLLPENLQAILDLAAQNPWVMIPGPMLDKYRPDEEEITESKVEASS
jgi:hypothetical protein